MSISHSVYNRVMAGVVASLLVACGNGSDTAETSPLTGGGAGTAGSAGANAAGANAAGGAGGNTAGAAGANTAGAGSAGAAGVDLAAACVAYQTAICNRLEACSPFTSKLAYGDVATCIQRTTISCPGIGGLPGVLDVRAELLACADKISTSDCSILFSNGVSGCELKGSLPDGASCIGNPQCQGGECLGRQGTACGTCGHKLPEGADCTTLSGDCEAGLTCFKDKCTHIGLLGDTCNLTAGPPCSPFLSCVAGKCTTSLPTGAACTPEASGCNSTLGQSCSSSTKTCTDLKLAQKGEPCGYDTTVMNLISCAGSLHCSGAVGGTCQERPKDGDPCTLDPKSTLDPCFSPARCIDNKCQPAQLICK